MNWSINLPPAVPMQRANAMWDCLSVANEQHIPDILTLIEGEIDSNKLFILC